MTFRSTFLPGAGPLDVAFDARGTLVAAIALDEQLTMDPMRISPPVAGIFDPGATLWVSPWGGSEPGFDISQAVRSFRLSGEPIAVAFSAAGKYIVQGREPATLQFEDGTSLSLSDESHADSGHRMFHMNSGIGIACASCHPEGGDDGHVSASPRACGAPCRSKAA